MEGLWVGRAVLFIVMTGSGALIWWMAEATASGRLGRNRIAGIRIPSTLASDAAWRAAHVRARRANVAAGVVAATGGLFALIPFPMPVTAVGVLVAAVAILALVLYGTIVGGRAARALSDPGASASRGAGA